MRNEVIIGKLIAYSEKILRYCDGITRDAFEDDTKLVEACVFNLSQMGELAKTGLTQRSRSSIRKSRGITCMHCEIESFTTMKA